jgi:hypothetical protein
MVKSNGIPIVVSKPPPVQIGYLPADDFPIPADQIQQGKVIVKLPDVMVMVPNGTTAPKILTGLTEKIFNKPYKVTVNLPALGVTTPAMKITMPMIQFDLPPVDIPSQTIHIGTMIIYSEQQ